MFISRINRHFKFSKEKWLVSIVSVAEAKNDIYQAAIVIEGVVDRRLLFACYEVFSKVCVDSTKEKPKAYIHHIDCCESSRYHRDFHGHASISYAASPHDCQQLSDHIHSIAKLFEKKDDKSAPAPELLIFPISIEKASLHWCLNFLSEHNILNRTEKLTS